jgi:parvulin-like peptidyl-prolyl isomerase
MLQSQELPTYTESFSFPMKLRIFFLCVLSAIFWPARSEAQAGRPAAPSPVVVTIDGVDYTASDIARLRATLPQQFAQTAAKFSNREFIEQYRRFLAMAKMAEKEGLAQKEPYRTQLESYRLLYLAQVYTTELSRSITVSKEEVRDYYDKHKSDFNEVRISAIYLDFDPGAEPGTPDTLTEAEAREKAEDLAAQLNGGADFAELAKQHSTDKSSAEKGGDLGFFKSSASLPAALHEAIFSLETGEVSGPIKEGTRFYILKATERREAAFESVQKEVANKLSGARFIEKAKEVSDSMPIEYKDEAYLRGGGAAQPGMPTVTVTPQNIQ